jgi:hypothetical protein
MHKVPFRSFYNVKQLPAATVLEIQFPLKPA